MPTRTSRLLIHAFSLMALAAPSVLGFSRPQLPAPGTAVISGVVQNGATGETVRDAVVFITATPARPLGSQTRQLTDERGRFAFVNLPGDVSYTISATGFGYLDGGYGRDTMPNDPLRPIAVKADDWISNIKVSIWKPGSISGVVRDESGEAVVGVVVRALQRVRIQGRDDFIGGPLTRTDDRGAYRLPGLAPGRYLLQVPSVQASVPTSIALPTADTVLPRALTNEALDLTDVDDTQRLVIGRYPLPPPPVNGRPLSYPSIFFPSSSMVADATTISLRYGEERAGVDVTLAPVASVRVSGTVDGPPEALRSLTVRLLPVGLENTGFGAEAATALVAPDGRFTFINVPAGNYTIDAPTTMSELTPGGAGGIEIGARRLLPGPPTTPVMGATTGPPIDLIPGLRLVTYNYRSGAPDSGRTSVTVGSNSDVSGVVLSLRLRATLAGSVVIDADPAGPAILPNAFSFSLDPAGGEAALGGAGRGGRGGGAGISINGIIPGQYFLRLTGAPDFLVKSITWNGHDYTSQPLDIGAGDTLTGAVVTLTNAVPELKGSVNDTDALKANATMVIAFPVNPALWKNTGWWPTRIKSAVVSTTKAFRLPPLPAGDYFVAAISRSFIETWREPDFLARVAPSATRVTLDWSGKSSLDLQTVVVR